jgi:hypothetical protein
MKMRYQHYLTVLMLSLTVWNQICRGSMRVGTLGIYRGYLRTVLGKKSEATTNQWDFSLYDDLQSLH